MVTPLLELRGITKAFGPKVANDNISLTVQPGRIHALVGENGAGKTTLMTMIAGTAQPDSGSIVYDGKPVRIANPQKASALGIGMVHQHFKLVPSLTVAANVYLGRELRTGRGTLDTASMESKVAALSEQFGLAIDPTATVSTLSVGLRQRVEVLKALSHDTRLLILDEPTAVLTPGEIDELFVVIRRLAAQGCAVLFISHKLGEVLSIADEITVIRDGRSIATVPAAGLSQGDIAQMMVGREVLLRIEHTPATPGDDVLAIRDLSVVDARGVTAVNSLNLTVRAGEIVGIAGVEGNGQTELAAAVVGMQTIAAGSISLRGADVTQATVAQRRAKGLASIPEDRHDVGTGPGLSVTENIIPTHLNPPVAKHGWVSNSAAAMFTRRLIASFDVRGAQPSTPIGTLSGGNIQKVVIARELTAEPTFLMVSQPTRGVDVGAMEFVHNAIVRQRDAGAGVLLVSADLNEVMSLSDRLVVMYRGAIIAEFTQETMSEAAVGLAMAGVRPSEQDVRAAEASHEAVAADLASAEPSLSAVEVAQVQEVVASATAGTGSSGAGEAPAAPRHVPEAALVAEPWTSRFQRGLRAAGRGAVQPLVAVAISLIIGAIVIVALGQDPIGAYGELFFSNFRSPHGISGFIAQFIPLAVLSAAVIVSFRAGFFNIGGEGQLFVGAFCGALAGFTFVDLPGPVLMVLMFAFGFIGGGLWGALPGWLLAKWRVDIIVSTLMLSTIATLLTAFLVTGPFKDPAAGLAASARIAPQARLSMFDARLGLGWDLVIALVIVVLLGLVLTRSVWGLRVRQLGEMNRFAEYTGVNPARMSVQVMALSGAVSGLAGVLFVMGPNGGRFLQTFSPGYGFLGITVALLARLNPWAAVVAAAFYANMMAGSNSMQLNTDVPYPLVNVLQGLIILSITATIILPKAMRARLGRMLRMSKNAEGSAVPAGAAVASTGFAVETPVVRAESTATTASGSSAAASGTESGPPQSEPGAPPARRDLRADTTPTEGEL